MEPSRTKFRKHQKGRIRDSVKGEGRHELASGDQGIKALEPCLLSSRQLEATRVALSKAMNRSGSIWIRVFPHKPITRKPAEVRMGKGKGGLAFFAAPVRPGTIIMEIGGVPEDVARRAIQLASQKLPVKTKMVTRSDYIT